MKLKIEIAMDNAAFEDSGYGNEAARLLRVAADEIEGRDMISTGKLLNLRDVNGNSVGEVKVTR